MIALTSVLVTDKSVEGKRAYGWANCALLAEKSDDGLNSAQLYNADNYRLFALAAFFDRTWWNAAGQKS